MVKKQSKESFDLAKNDMFIFHGKIRGLRRKCKRMKLMILKETSVFPEAKSGNKQYWHLHLPVSEKFIDSYSTPKRVRRFCIKILLQQVKHLIEHRVTESFCKVVAAISFPNLIDSQIIVFFDEHYWSTFFSRESSYQRWIPLSKERSFLMENSLLSFSCLSEKGFKQITRYEGFYQENEIWFFGDN